jgi:hypothetical protein
MTSNQDIQKMLVTQQRCKLTRAVQTALYEFFCKETKYLNS